MYSDILSGGDIHTLHMAAGAIERGFPVRFLAGHAMQTQLESRQMPATIGLTDKGKLPPGNFDSLSGQLRLFRDYLRRLVGTLGRRHEIRPGDVVYANTDFWWDSIPTLVGDARGKLMILGMDCPTLWEVVTRGRPDVKPIRLPSLHYWLSQQFGLRLFRRCRNKKLFYVHPDQKPRLLGMGFREEELMYISNGVDIAIADGVPPQEKVYDVVWTGRVHQQKGIEDLLDTLAHLAREVKGFKAVLVGNVKKALGPRIEAAGLAGCVDFAGFVPEEEKFRLMKASRLFLMPSYYESWGIVIGEALGSGTPVLAYDLAAYRPVFGDLVRYVPFHDPVRFKHTAREMVEAIRVSGPALDPVALARFKQENSWEEARRKFCQAAASFPELVRS